MDSNRAVDSKVTLAITTRRLRDVGRAVRENPGPLDAPLHIQAGSRERLTAHDAIERAVGDMRGLRIGVVGRHAESVAEWLRQTGSDAETVTLSGKARTSTKAGARAGARRSALVAVGCLEYAPAPGELLAAMRRMLVPDGRLIVVVPNVTHASVRLAILQGRYPPGTGDATRGGNRFTSADVERLLNHTGFVVTGIERQVDSEDVLNEIGGSMPASVLSMLAQDVDAMTSHFAFVAVPDEVQAIHLLHRRVRQHSDEQLALLGGARVLGERVAELELRVRHWAAETDALGRPGLPSAEAFADLQTRVQHADRRQGEFRDDLDALRRAVSSLGTRDTDGGQTLAAIGRLEARLQTVAEQVASAASREAERDAAFQHLRDRVVARTGEMKALLRRIEQARYRRLVTRLRSVVERELPRGSTVAVVSRGDDALLAFDGRSGWHFPQTSVGVYAGHHPADSQAAIADLKAVRARGAEYLVIPRTAFWWLEHYRELNEHLLRRHRSVFRDQHTCAVFALGGSRRR
jgi:Skp family chaperone for outer membrane proteins